VTLTEFQRELCETSPFDFTDLRALYVNCTLKRSPEQSHTEGLMRVSMAIMELNGVEVDYARLSTTGICCTPRGCSRTRAAYRRTATSAHSGMRAVASTLRNPDYR
jgi:hypothetical protein